MATEETPLVSGQGSINTPQSSEDAPTLWQAAKDIRAGRVHIGPVLLYTLIAVIGSFLFGYVLGYSSLTELSISPNHTGSSHVKMNFELSSTQISYFGAVVAMAALVAGLVTGFISDNIGRKPSMLLGCLPLVFGWSIVALSICFVPDDKANFYIMLMVGRGLTGLGVGCLSLVVPNYIVEIAPTNLKGLLGATHQLSITIGNLAVYFLGSYVQYHIVALVASAVVVIYSFGILFIPETPRWLLVNGKQMQAMEALQKLRGRKTDINKEMGSLVDTIKEEGESTFVEKLMEFKKKSVIIALVLILALMLFQQFCGITAIIFYGASIAKSAGIHNADLTASLGIGLTQVIMTFVSVLLIDLLGRKKLLVAGGSLLLLGTILLGLYYILCPTTDKHPYCHHLSYMAVAALVVFITGFSIGWGAIPWVMMSELAPLKVRGIMGGIATATSWSFVTIVTQFFSKYQSDSVVHPYGAWWTFAGFILLSIPFVIFFLPETKEKTLEEIQSGLDNYDVFANVRGGQSIH